MNKKQMVDAILESLPKGEKDKPASRLQVESILESYGNVAAAELLGGGEISLQGVGKLKTRATSSRAGRNPRTGEKITIPASRKVSFVPFKDFKDALKGE